MVQYVVLAYPPLEINEFRDWLAAYFYICLVGCILSFCGATMLTNNSTYFRCHWRGHWCVIGCHVGHSIFCEWVWECNLSPGKPIMCTSLHHADYRVLFLSMWQWRLLQLLAGGGLAPHSLCHEISRNQCTRIHVLSTICIFNIIYIYKLFTLATSTLTPICGLWISVHLPMPSYLSSPLSLLMIEHSLASQVEQLADDWALTVCIGVAADIRSTGNRCHWGRCHRGSVPSRHGTIRLEAWYDRPRNSPGYG